jgi:hypothetical protein
MLIKSTGSPRSRGNRAQRWRGESPLFFIPAFEINGIACRAPELARQLLCHFEVHAILHALRNEPLGRGVLVHKGAALANMRDRSRRSYET